MGGGGPMPLPMQQMSGQPSQMQGMYQQQPMCETCLPFPPFIDGFSFIFPLVSLPSSFPSSCPCASFLFFDLQPRTFIFSFFSMISRHLFVPFSSFFLLPLTPFLFFLSLASVLFFFPFF
jgi:hypothetical protein